MGEERRVGLIEEMTSQFEMPSIKKYYCACYQIELINFNSTNISVKPARKKKVAAITPTNFSLFFN